MTQMTQIFTEKLYLLNNSRRSWLSLSKPTACDKLRPRLPQNIEKIPFADAKIKITSVTVY